MARAPRSGLGFDPREVGFERHTLEGLPRSGTGVRKYRTGEQHRPGVELPIHCRVGERSRPDQLVRNTSKVEIGGEAAANRYQPENTGKRCGKAPKIIFCPSGKTVIQVMHTILSTRPPFTLDAIAIFEVADLVGEGDVVRVGGPWHSRVLAGGGVHGMEIIRYVVSGAIAVRPARIVEDLSEAIGSTGGHRTNFPGSQVGNRNLQPVCRVPQDDTQNVAGVVEECVLVGRERLVVLKQWAGRASGHPAFRDEREVYILNCSAAG